MSRLPENTRPELASLVAELGGARILCVGDLMLDHFVYGEVTRISPEGPVPVLKVQHSKRMLGGAGNAVRNLTALGARTTVVSIVGDDPAGEEIMELLSDCGCADSLVQRVPSRPTTTKTRFVARGQQLMRTDVESSEPIPSVSFGRLEETFAAALQDCSAVLLSDYDKGVLSGENASQLIRMAQAAGKPVIVDPKGSDYDRYRGAALLKPNFKEFRLASRSRCESEDETVAAARAFLDACGVEHLLITRGAAGMLLLSVGGDPIQLPAIAREVFDVSGAGDTVAAVLACGLGVGAPLAIVAELANLAAGIVVGKAGTATIKPAELLAGLGSVQSMRSV